MRADYRVGVYPRVAMLTMKWRSRESGKSGSWGREIDVQFWWLRLGVIGCKKHEKLDKVILTLADDISKSIVFLTREEQ